MMMTAANTSAPAVPPTMVAIFDIFLRLDHWSCDTGKKKTHRILAIELFKQAKLNNIHYLLQEPEIKWSLWLKLPFNYTGFWAYLVLTADKYSERNLADLRLQLEELMFDVRFQFHCCRNIINQYSVETIRQLSFLSKVPHIAVQYC